MAQLETHHDKNPHREVYPLFLASAFLSGLIHSIPSLYALQEQYLRMKEQHQDWHELKEWVHDIKKNFEQSVSDCMLALNRAQVITENASDYWKNRPDIDFERQSAIRFNYARQSISEQLDVLQNNQPHHEKMATLLDFMHQIDRGFLKMPGEKSIFPMVWELTPIDFKNEAEQIVTEDIYLSARQEVLCQISLLMIRDYCGLDVSQPNSELGFVKQNYLSIMDWLKQKTDLLVTLVDKFPLTPKSKAELITILRGHMKNEEAAFHIRTLSQNRLEMLVTPNLHDKITKLRVTRPSAIKEMEEYTLIQAYLNEIQALCDTFIADKKVFTNIHPANLDALKYKAQKIIEIICLLRTKYPHFFLPHELNSFMRFVADIDPLTN